MIHAWTRRHTVARDRRARDAAPHPGGADRQRRDGDGARPVPRARRVRAGARTAASCSRGRRTGSDAGRCARSRPHRASASTPAGVATARAAGAAPGDGAALPFAGLRVLDFTMFWAGPFVGHFLAALGADVIKVESIQRPDGIRFASTAQPTAERWWEWCGDVPRRSTPASAASRSTCRARAASSSRARSSRGADVRGRELLAARARQPRPRATTDLARENPRLVMVRMPAFGLDGPWRDRTGFAQTMEQVSGMAWVTGFADGPPVIPRGPCDPLAGMHAVLALLVALEHRRRTGEGQLVESTMVEAALNATAEQVLERQAYGRLVAPRRQPRPGRRAAEPLRVPRRRSSGSRIAVATDAQWARARRRARSPVVGDGRRARDGARAGARRTTRSTPRSLACCGDQERDALVERAPRARASPRRRWSIRATLAQRTRSSARADSSRPSTHPVTGTHAAPGPADALLRPGRAGTARPRRRSASTRRPCCASCSASTTRRSPRCAPSASSASARSESDVRIIAGEFRGRRIEAPPGSRDATHARPRPRGPLLDAPALAARCRRARPLRRLGQPRPRSAFARRAPRALRRARRAGAGGARGRTSRRSACATASRSSSAMR